MADDPVTDLASNQLIREWGRLRESTRLWHSGNGDTITYAIFVARRNAVGLELEKRLKSEDQGHQGHA